MDNDGARAHGYGADLAFNGVMVTIYPGEEARRLTGTDRIQFPLVDVDAIDYKGADALTNGELRFAVADVTPTRLNFYGGRVLPLPGTPERRAFDQQGAVTPGSLVVHWRRTDQAAFEEISDAIRARHVELADTIAEIRAERAQELEEDAALDED